MARQLIALIGSLAFFTTSSPLANADFPAHQEQISDFGRFVPEHEVLAESPFDTVLERVTTAVPWGRGMAKVEGELIVLSRGRHRGEGGIDQDIIDQAGTLWRVDTAVAEPVIPGQWAGDAVRTNAEVFAEPTSPPFHLYDYESAPEDDTRMARPYCAIAYDASSHNFYICAYSGAELSTGFRKHGTDAVYRYDTRNGNWHVVEQHNPNVIPDEQLGAVISNEHYPHHDPTTNDAPHGWLNGANGCIAVGQYLYVPAKDNHVIGQYNLGAIRKDPNAGPPPSRIALDSSLTITYPGGEKEVDLYGPNGVAIHDDFLYVSYRTSSVVVRIKLDDAGDIVREPDGRVKAQLIGVFEPWSADNNRSANLYDIAMNDNTGELFVSVGTEGKMWRFMPDPERPFYGNDQTDRPTTAPPFLDMSQLLGRPTSCNNIYVDSEDDYLYISSRANDNGEGVIHGTIYRVKLYSK